MTQTELFGEQKCAAPPIESALDDEVRGAYEKMTPSERQEVLDKLGVLYGFPYRAYTTEEWLTAYRETLGAPADGQCYSWD